MEFWRTGLGAPTKVVAPMVDSSELAWRVLSRRYGAHLCYTPMLHSSIFCRDAKYRKEALTSCAEDKPLIVQFCGNDPNVMLEAALLAQSHCAAIDINLGCPQGIAKRGHYGAYLQDEWPLLFNIVRTLSENLRVAVTCKVRRFESVQKTIDYCKMLEEAGCQMLTVHGRTRDQKGPLTGVADWSFVNAVRKAVNIPVLSNGNIQCLEDYKRCLNETGAVGVMIAEGNLYNPALFLGENPPVWQPALEYLNLCQQYTCPISYIRGHLFKLFHHVLALEVNSNLRMELGAANNLQEFYRIANVIKATYEPYNEGKTLWLDNSTEAGNANLKLPPWLCQVYVRQTPLDYIKKLASLNDTVDAPKNENVIQKTLFKDSQGNIVSRKKMKKLRRIGRRPPKIMSVDRRQFDTCCQCPNPMSQHCEFKMCKNCCRNNCYENNQSCIGHRILRKMLKI